MKRQNLVGVKYDTVTSFLLSVFIYFALIFLLLFQVSKMKDLAIKYTDDKNAYMDVIVDWDIDDSAPKAPEISKENSEKSQKEEPKEEIKQAEVVEQKTEKQSEKVEKPKEEPKSEIPDITKPVQKETKKPEKEKPNLNDLFNETTKDNKKLTENTKNTNLDNEAKKDSSKNAVQQADKKSGRSQMTGQFNAFLGGVEKKLKILWSRYSANSNDDALVEITIGANGKVVDYKILELSYNSEFNQKLRTFMDSLTTQDFPKPPDGKPYTISKINLKDKI